MFSLLHSLDPYSYTHRSYLISEGDDFSALKAVEFEKGLAESVARSKRSSKKGEGKGAQEAAIGTYSLHAVPRARRIHQSLLSTPLSSLHCLISCLKILLTPPRDAVPAMPDLILLNGPGTAVIVVFASLLLRFFGLGGRGLANTPPHRQTQRRTRTIYIESWARVQKLSLSGRILAACGAVDRLLVQWEPLKGKGGAEWMGWMVR